MKVLITGGAGYIGSSIASCCADAGITPVILDDFSTGLHVFGERFACYEGDIADVALLERVFADHPDIDAVIHCAAKIVVPESVEQPLAYYDNNVGKAITLLSVMERFGVRRFVLSSTASMYEPGPDYMVDETSAVDPQSPYAASKWLLERVLRDTAATGSLGVVALRYFNPIGADPSLRTGLQNPRPTHAMGKMIEAHAAGEPFTVTGVDWPTRDGSGLRDYIHVWDLARAHVAVLERFDAVVGDSGYDVINLGTGQGTTVFELAEAFGEATGTPLEVRTGPARPGDVVGSASRTDKARSVLGWSAERSLVDGVRDALAWAKKLPAVLAEEEDRKEASR
ncbi:UDP-glucose 4-epimerase GalE [Corynebacterium sp. MSK008]|uniref:UDP-glucose 4-epimerase GalE n=1 Tax=Corynebacterium sp. MSK008 TaxID=3050188 RepID=UPI00254FDFE4|nr:UDP-glucose 4-epimerase GalE [Corynebacterium sp. MSK008]MDK8879332.1 UDP-glucose 4-epimerase GalE [Corynebacterium sp. MSK008]